MIHPTITNEYEVEILELIENKNNYTTSDLQGIITLVVNKILVAGQRLQLQEQLQELTKK